MENKKPNNEEIIKDFLSKMATQDNRGTAVPFYYVIRTREWRAVPEECFSGDDDCKSRTRFYSEDRDEFYDSLSEYVNEFMDESDVFGYAERQTKSLKEVHEVSYWDEKGMFFTEEDAKEHLRRNKHHYTEDAHTYVKHAWRAPFLKEFINALFEHFEVKKGNYK